MAEAAEVEAGDDDDVHESVNGRELGKDGIESKPNEPNERRWVSTLIAIGRSFGVIGSRMKEFETVRVPCTTDGRRTIPSSFQSRRESVKNRAPIRASRGLGGFSRDLKRRVVARRTKTTMLSVGEQLLQRSPADDRPVVEFDGR